MMLELSQRRNIAITLMELSLSLFRVSFQVILARHLIPNCNRYHMQNLVLFGEQSGELNGLAMLFTLSNEQLVSQSILLSLLSFHLLRQRTFTEIICRETEIHQPQSVVGLSQPLAWCKREHQQGRKETCFYFAQTTTFRHFWQQNSLNS